MISSLMHWCERFRSAGWVQMRIEWITYLKMLLEQPRDSELMSRQSRCGGRISESRDATYCSLN